MKSKWSDGSVARWIRCGAGGGIVAICIDPTCRVVKFKV